MPNREQMILDAIAELEAQEDNCELCGGTWHGLRAQDGAFGRTKGCPGMLATPEEKLGFVPGAERYEQALPSGMTARTPAPWALHGQVKVKDYWTTTKRSRR